MNKFNKMYNNKVRKNKVFLLNKIHNNKAKNNQYQKNNKRKEK